MSRIDDEDERVAAVMKGLDKTIEECDELDGLLTLYNVELSVSGAMTLQFYSITDSSRLSMKILLTLKRKAKVFKFKQPTRSSYTPN